MLEVLDNSMARDLAGPRSRWKVQNLENVDICDVFGMFIGILHGYLCDSVFLLEAYTWLVNCACV